MSEAGISSDLLDALEEELQDHSGPEEAVSSSELAERITGEDTEANPKTREAIRVLVEERAMPIAASHRGYFLIENEQQLDEYLEQLRARKVGIETRIQLTTQAWAAQRGREQMPLVGGVSDD